MALLNCGGMAFFYRNRHSNLSPLSVGFYDLKNLHIKLSDVTQFRIFEPVVTIATVAIMTKMAPSGLNGDF